MLIFLIHDDCLGVGKVGFDIAIQVGSIQEKTTGVFVCVNLKDVSYLTFHTLVNIFIAFDLTALVHS